MLMAHCLWLLPLFGVICAVCAFSTSYIMAVIRGDVYPWWPYISDTGTTVPESCIFGELLTLTAILMLCSMFVRYKLVQAFTTTDKKLSTMNIAALVIGTISCFGMTLVANFQETSVRAVHLPGAMAAFGFAVIYNFIHSFISKKMYPTYNGYCIWVLRLSISIAGLLSFLSMYSFGEVSWVQGKKWYGNDSAKKLDWDPQDPGWPMHLVSSVSEWLVGLTCMLFFLTYIKEFRRIKLKVVPELLVSHLDEMPEYLRKRRSERTPLITERDSVNSI